MARRELCRPDLVVGAGRVCVLPHVRDIERVFDHASANFVAKQPVEDVFVDRQSALREDGIAKLLELLHDLVVHAGIMMIWTPKHHDPNTVLALEHVQRLASTFTQPVVVGFLGFESHFDGAIILFF